MTTAQLIERYRQSVAYDLDPIVGQDAADAQIVSVLNEAMVELATAAYLTDPAVALTLSPNVGSYALEGSAFARRVVEPFGVVLAGARLLAASGADYGLWTTQELVDRYPTWPSDAPGTPRRAIWTGDRLLLHPAPSTVVAAYVDARILPPSLSEGSLLAQPDLPVRLHPAIVQRAIYATCGINAQEGSQFKRLADQAAEALSIATAIGKKNRDARIGMPTTWAGDVPSFVSL